MNKEKNFSIDLEDVEIAFLAKTDHELKRSLYIFKVMQIPFIVKLSSKLGLWLIKMNFPFVKQIIRKTIFQQFCGGETLNDCQLAITRLQDFKVQTILDYGAEAKSSVEDFKSIMDEFIGAILYAATNDAVPTVSMKVTGLIDFELLVKLQAGEIITDDEKRRYSLLQDRLNQLAVLAEQKSVRLFVDAEESWIQDIIDELVTSLQETYNQKKAIVYNTFQMYRHDRLDYLKRSYKSSVEKQYLLGAKLVRGAYMEKERQRAKELNYTSPIQKDKSETDKDYNKAIAFCMEHIETISMYNASHNIESSQMMTQLIEEKKLAKNHPHINFCQLYGMSDYITFNLASAGYSVTKYMPYGKIKEVIPYLIRRAQENTSVKGEMGREYQMTQKEYMRRMSK